LKRGQKKVYTVSKKEDESPRGESRGRESSGRERGVQLAGHLGTTGGARVNKLKLPKRRGLCGGPNNRLVLPDKDKHGRLGPKSPNRLLLPWPEKEKEGQISRGSTKNNS